MIVPLLAPYSAPRRRRTMLSPMPGYAPASIFSRLCGRSNFWLPIDDFTPPFMGSNRITGEIEMAERRDAEPSPPDQGQALPGFEHLVTYHGSVSPAIVMLAGLLARQAARKDFEAAKGSAKRCSPRRCVTHWSAAMSKTPFRHRSLMH